MITELVSPPSDTISDASYKNNILIISSWDKSLQFYNTKENKLLKKIITNTPILSHTCINDKIIYGGLDEILYSYDFNKDIIVKLYRHKNVINNICYQKSSNFLCVSDWNKGLNIFDDRTKNGLICEISTFGLICSMDINETKLLACDSLKRTYIFDTQKGIDSFHNPYYKDNILRYQFRCIKAFPNQKGFVVSSIEGRVAWELFDNNPSVQSKNYSFRCHRIKTDESEVAYPINTIDFHPIYGAFCTGGSDGIMCVWDGYNRKRIWRTQNFKNEITKVKFNNEGDEICICVSSYLKNSNNPNDKMNSVIIRKVTDKDVKPS
ncbi:mitotic checkpoint protein BUB3, putative [Plasmodium gallinaceum]|uniref:Mitotic checkpoint protein BUB3, putative n=1 Tax=Plasmodium gallinaceum TaxID=5849 RepID=A0A1J1GQE7_PLAGA|nr:mitotic checkpoint protein BUB3, putative [Plasmodium gallinaceum]CRG94640.1 mitotic checkpoint protein BUB3, putative [Plasmodium gallinaceum]